MSTLSQFLGSSSKLPISIFPTLFGNGSDGAATISADTDGGYLSFGFKQYTNLTINSGVNLQCPAGSGNGGIFIAVLGTLTVNGTIRANGENGSNAVSGTSGAGGRGAGGFATAAAGVGAGSVGTAASAQTVNGLIVPAGYNGGAGGGATSNLGINGGIGLTGSIQTSANTPVYRSASGIVLPYRITTNNVSSGTAAPAVDSGVSYAWSPEAPIGGGGGGGGGATGNPSFGGGGGGGGGIIYIEAQNVVFGGSAILQAIGGNGGNAFNSGGTWASNGGAGGNGGRIIIICRSVSGSPSTNVSGGTGGAKADSGNPSPSGSNGENGNAGIYALIRV